jgi:lysozyme
MMQLSQNGLNLIKGFEGYSAVPYYCDGGVLTIGWGHTVKADERFTEINEQEAEQLLKNDCAFAVSCVSRLVKVSLNQNQFDALVSLVFNIGSRNFAGSTLLKLLNAQDYRGAASQFLRWKYAGGIVLSGLVNRRNLERQLFLKGLV